MRDATINLNISPLLTLGSLGHRLPKSVDYESYAGETLVICMAHLGAGYRQER